MGFFDSRGNASKPEQQVVTAEKAKPKSSGTVESGRGTLIGRGMVFEGVTSGAEDIVIEGTIKGELNCEKHVMVGESGLIEAIVSCRSITVRGQVKGNVEARDRITIESTGKLIGDITAKVFINQPGGFFEGYSHMLTGRTEKPKTDQKPNDAKRDRKGN